MFFVPYTIFQPPMTVIIRKIGPTYFLSAIILGWGATMIVRASVSFMAVVLTLRQGDGFHEELASAGRYSCYPWLPGSGILSRLCVPVVMLVRAM